MPIEWSVAVIALSFVVLVIYSIRTLHAAKQSMEQVNQTLQNVQRQLDELGQETLQWMQNTNRLTTDVQKKLKSTDSFFQSVGQTGEAVEQVTATVKQVSAAITANVDETFKSNQTRMKAFIGWAGLAMDAWQRWKSKPQGDGKDVR